jgi:hypothetical protein
MIPALSNRRAVLKMPKIHYVNDQDNPRRVEYVITDISYWLPEAEVRRVRDEIRRTVPPIDRLLDNRHYGVVSYEDGIVLLKRGAMSDPESLSEWRSLRRDIEPL